MISSAYRLPEPTFPRLLDTPSLHRDLTPPPIPADEADHMPILVNGYAARISVWTDEEWQALDPDRRPHVHSRVKGVWLSPSML
jgi:hypothetical protein